MADYYRIHNGTIPEDRPIPDGDPEQAPEVPQADSVDVKTAVSNDPILSELDDENPDDFLRQTAEALKQGGSKCVVIRGNGAYCVGADLDDAWANAAMLEHSMRIVLLARQANLKI